MERECPTWTLQYEEQTFRHFLFDLNNKGCQGPIHTMPSNLRGGIFFVEVGGAHKDQHCLFSHTSSYRQSISDISFF